MQVKRTHYGWKMYGATAYARTHIHHSLYLNVFLCIHGQHQVENGENAIRSVENDGIYDNPFRSDVVVGL